MHSLDNTPIAARALALAIIHSLDQDGERWSREKYTMAHSSGVQLFVYSYSMKVWKPRLIEFRWLDRPRVRAAVRRWLKRNPQNRIDEGADIIAALRP